MPKIKIILVPILAMVITTLASCDLIAGTALPTPYPTEHMPTVIAMTVTAQGIVIPAANPDAALSETPTLPAPTQASTSTSPPLPTSIPATATPTPTQSILDLTAPDNIPESAIQILNPGHASKVVSPFSLRAALKPGLESVIRIELLGEDGRLLMREVRSFDNPNNDWHSLSSEVDFGIPGAAESGRLQISVEDEQGRLKSLSSVEIYLLARGIQDLNLPLDHLEDIVIESPRPHTLIQGGMMRVAGLARPRSNQPLLVEISTSDGRIVGTRQVSVSPSPGSSYGPFEIDVPFKVESTTRVLVQIWEPGDIIPGIVNLSSLEVILSP